MQLVFRNVINEADYIYFKNCPKKKAAIGARISELHILIVA